MTDTTTAQAVSSTCTVFEQELVDFHADVDALWRARQDVEARAAQLVAVKVRELWPTAVWLELDVSDQGGDDMIGIAVHSATEPFEENLWDYDVLTELLSCMHDDGAWTVWRAYPFGTPERHTTGRPCLDIARVLGPVA